MVDPQRITNFERTDAELEEFLLFSVCVAGHNAQSTAQSLDKYLDNMTGRPFRMIEFDLLFRDGGVPYVASELKKCGIGCYNARAKSFKALVDSKLDLRTCSREDLQRIPGIGPKTANFFLMHSRKGYRGAALDTHILKFLRDSGVENVPKSTPGSVKNYARLEAAFLALVPPWQSVADFDLEVWKRYAGR